MSEVCLLYDMPLITIASSFMNRLYFNEAQTFKIELLVKIGNFYLEKSNKFGEVPGAQILWKPAEGVEF